VLVTVIWLQVFNQLHIALTHNLPGAFYPQCVYARGSLDAHHASAAAPFGELLRLYTIFFGDEVVGNAAKYRKPAEVGLLAVGMFVG